MRLVHLYSAGLLLLAARVLAQDDNNNEDSGDASASADADASASQDEKNNDNASASDSNDDASASDDSSEPTATLPSGYSQDSGDAPAIPESKGASGYGPDDSYIAGAAAQLEATWYAGVGTALAVGTGALWLA